MNQIGKIGATRRGSVLVFSLLILSIMLVASLTILSSAVLDRKASLSTGSSTRSFQVADSGVEEVLHQIYKGTGNTNLSALAGKFVSGGSAAICNSGSIVFDTAGEKAKVTFYQDATNVFSGCEATDWRDKVVKIKSEGTAGSTTRAVEVAVEAAPRDGLVGHWTFDEGSGLTASDSSHNHNHGALTNMESTDWVPGAIGGALEFDGTSGTTDRVTIPKSATLDLDNTMTLSFWIKDTGTPNGGVSCPGCNYAPFIRKRNLDGYMIQHNTATRNIYLRIDTNLVTNKTVGFVGALDGGWHFVAYSMENGDGKYWMDDTVPGTFTYLHGNGFGASSADLIVAGGDASAIIDDVRLYNRALEDDEVQKLYELGPH